MSLLFCRSSQWENWVTKTQLSVLMPSQHASAVDGTYCPAAGHDISFNCQMACWIAPSSWLTGRDDCWLDIYHWPTELNGP